MAARNGRETETVPEWQAITKQEIDARPNPPQITNPPRGNTPERERYAVPCELQYATPPGAYRMRKGNPSPNCKYVRECACGWITKRRSEWQAINDYIEHKRKGGKQ